VEILFKNTIGDNPSVIRKIREKFGIDGRFITAINNGIHCEKAAMDPSPKRSPRPT
jgi:hypothetical protein